MTPANYPLFTVPGCLVCIVSISSCNNFARYALRNSNVDDDHNTRMHTKMFLVFCFDWANYVRYCETKKNERRMKSRS